MQSDGGASATVFAGTLEGAQGQAPPQHSWAADAANEVAVWHITIPAGATFELPVSPSNCRSPIAHFFFALIMHVWS